MIIFRKSVSESSPGGFIFRNIEQRTIAMTCEPGNIEKRVILMTWEPGNT